MGLSGDAHMCAHWLSLLAMPCTTGYSLGGVQRHGISEWLMRGAPPRGSSCIDAIIDIKDL